MKKLLMFHFEACPYSKRAFALLDELIKEYPAFKDIPIETIDEKLHPEIADKYDYWYVPTIYLEGKKVHEGAIDKDALHAILNMALE